MSSVTNTSQSSASGAVRLAKLQTLHQVLMQGKSDKHIFKAFASLKKIDQEGIRRKILVKKIGPSKFEQKKALVSVVKGHIRTLIQSKTDRAFKTSDAKGRITTNPFSTVPIPVQTTVTGSFCVPKDLANFRASFKDAAKIESASHIIKTYHLDHLIETYLHRSCSDLNESDKTKALHELMSVAYSLSEIEELPKPGYSSLSTFFQEVEARNLIRMMGKIDEAQELPDFPEGIMDLQVPKDPTKTIQKAERLRDWTHQYRDFLAGIIMLELDGCFLSLLPKEIGQLQALRRLYLNNNCLIRVPKEIGQLQALRWLHLDNNHLARVPKEIGQLQVLEELYLHNNHLVRVPKEIGQLKTLRVLYLDNNRLVSMPKEIGQLRALQWLHLDNNPLVSVPKEIDQLQKLKGLYLHNNRLVSAPKEIGQLKALQILYLGNNHLISVPKEIGQLQALQILHLETNRLVSVPKEIGQLQALQILHLGNNHLISVPKEIGQLKALQILYLGNNHLVSVPKEIGQLQALQILHLETNRLVSVPKEIGQLQALQRLSLNNNHLVRVPKEIDQLQALQRLSLNNNHLVRVPKEIDQLQALEILYLENNRLVSVPKEIGQLQALQRLSLNNNRLVSVPKEIGQLQALERLSLNNNGLISLPIELDRFKGNLKRQNKQLQLKNILRRLFLCVNGQHNTTKIADLFDTMERLLGNETRSQIHRCLYGVAQKAAKTDKTLGKRLKDKHFARKAFLDENISPKLKAAAIATFRKSLEKQGLAKITVPSQS